MVESAHTYAVAIVSQGNFKTGNITAAGYFGQKGLLSDRYCQRGLNCKAFSACTTPGRIRITEMESFSVQSICEVQGGVYQVKETFQVSHNFDPFVFKNLVGWLALVIEIHFVTET